MINDLRIESKSVRAQSGNVMMQVSLYSGKKLETQTNMSLDDYVTLLQGAKRKKERPLSVNLGTVPEGLYDGFVTNTEGTLGGIFYIPPQRHQFILAKTNNHPRKAYYLAMPGLVYSLIFREKVKVSMKCFAYKTWQGDDTILYAYPFGNVSNEGNVCMGNVKTDDVTSFSDIRDYIEASLDGVTNGDYLGTEEKVRLSVDQMQYDFCNFIQDREDFPLELLLESKKITTVAQLKKDFFVSAEAM